MSRWTWRGVWTAKRGSRSRRPAQRRSPLPLPREQLRRAGATGAGEPALVEGGSPRQGRRVWGRNVALSRHFIPSHGCPTIPSHVNLLSIRFLARSGVLSKLARTHMDDPAWRSQAGAHHGYTSSATSEPDAHDRRFAGQSQASEAQDHAKEAPHDGRPSAPEHDESGTLARRKARMGPSQAERHEGRISTEDCKASVCSKDQSQAQHAPWRRPSHRS